MIQKIMDLRNESSLFRKAPDAYGKMIQKQMDKEGMGTVYIDAQAAAEDRSTHEVLNEIVEKGIVSAKELDESIKTGKPLTIESGKYMQLASEEAPKVLSDYTTMDKGERTIHDLNEIRNREKELRDLIHSTKAEREQRAGREIMDANFPANGTEFDKEDRATFASLLPGGLENLKDNAKEALKEAMENWMDMLPDVKEHMEYIRQKQNGKGQGEVSVIYRENDSQGAQWETVRVSSNDAWYSAAFKEKGSMPGQRDIIDYDHEQYLKELEASVKPGDAEGEMLIQNLKDAKKRVESLERVNHFISNLDKKDLTAQALLDPETYEKVYKPYLTQIQLAAKGTKAEAAARDSALILSKIAENMNKNYGIPLELAMAKIMKGQEQSHEALGQYMSTEDQLKIDAQYFMDQVNNALDGNLKSKYIRVMRTPLVMKLVGAKILPIHISANKLAMVFKNHAESIDRDLLEQIPGALADPMMVFKTYNGKDKRIRKVFVLDLKDKNGATIVVPIELDDTDKGYEFNKIISLYSKNYKETGKPRYDYFKVNIALETVEYINKKKTATWYSSEEVHSSIPEETMSSLLNSNLPNENDLVKLKEKYPTYYQMAGERANTAPEGKLQRAASMEKDGRSPEEIWKATGWMRGPDHKWRFEIPDNLDEIDFTIAKDGELHFLEEIYNNPALYEAYPELKDIQIRLEKINKTKNKQVKNAAGYVNENGNIIIDKDIPVYEMKEVLVHEIQHVIQYKERFSTGGNIYTVKGQIQDTIDKLNIDLHEIELKNPKARAYMDKANEIIDSVNEFNFTRAKQLNEERKTLLDTLPEEERKELSTIERDLDLLEDAAKQDDYAAYRRLSGEAEAFMTQERAKNTDKSMPNYNTPYGPAVINLGGNELPFFASKEMNKEVSTINKFYEQLLQDIKNGWRDSSEKWTDPNGVTFHGERITHVKNEHAITKNDLVEIEENINNLYSVGITARKGAGSYGGIRILALIKGKQKSYRIVLEFLSNGNVKFDTVLSGKTESIIKDIETHTAQMLSEKSAASSLGRAVSMSIPNIQEALGIVKKNTYKQTEGYEKDLVVYHNVSERNLEGDRQNKTKNLGSLLNVYFQSDKKYQGAYDPAQNVIELFDGANQSTVIHEGAHMFLSLLEKMENLTEEDIENYFEGDRDKAAKTSERVRKDLSTIREWAAFSEEHLEEYKGTVLEKEFNKHAEDIRNGVEGAEERWIQERFARGFEKYLAEGYAPTKELRGVFRRFKSWLKDVYKSAKNLGSARLSPEIKDSFDHMISVAIESKGSL